MLSASTPSPKRKVSRSSGSRRLKAFASRAKPNLGLALDTSVTRHRGSKPQQVFPYESESAEARSSGVQPQASDGNRSLKAQLENGEPMRPVPYRSTTETGPMHADLVGLPSRPDFFRNRTAAHPTGNQAGQQRLGAPALHKRIKGLRPSPLDLNDVSPSDRVIPIGIAVPTTALSHHTASPLSRDATGESGAQAREATTPTIIITPAREDFGLDRLPGSPHDYVQRPVSSVYSRYTNCAPRTANFEVTPPVPPLPLFAQQPRTHAVHESTATLREESASAQSHKATMSVCTVFEEDQDSLSPLRSARSLGRQRSRRMTSQSALPTPRRSRGWWNFITSPFSARTDGHLWRSPVDHGMDTAAILDDASPMGTAQPAHHYKLGDNDLAVRSATLDVSSHTSARCDRFLPQRSFTAPGALDANAPRLNIYRVPSTGEAAAYYDQTRHFPSLLIGSSDSLPRSFFEDDSPLTDVCACEHHSHGVKQPNTPESDSAADDEHLGDSKDPEASDSPKASCKCWASPFSDAHAVDGQRDSGGPDRALFTSPTADELKSTTPTRPAPDRSHTQGTSESQSSPLSATPVVESAHIATFVGPSSDHGEQKAVVLAPTHTPERPAAGLQTATMASRGISADEPSQAPPERSVMHSRNDSYGLGITSSEKDLFPPPKMISEKPRLGTDRFGQLKLIIPGPEKPTRPWYRRFFWLLASVCTAVLLLLVVLLVILVPRQHGDVAVQGQWLNLTGYPALPTGITTVVQPNTVAQEAGCVNPSGLWSCSARQTYAPSGTPSQPDFRLEIRFRNGTTANKTLVEPTVRRRSGAATVRSKMLSRRGSWLNGLLTTSPSPPSTDDRLFLGSTADNVSLPYEGEETPFFLSLLDAAPLSGLHKRQDNPYPYPTASMPSNSTSETTASRNASTAAPGSIPKASMAGDGRPQAELLYPLVQAQPLRLFNRGQDDEHYGFYTYFDRTTYIANTTSTGSASNGTVSASPTLKGATAVCTWSQTRLRVSIWTRKTVSSLLPGTSFTMAVSNGTTAESIAAVNSTANDMAAPGSFPYPITISLDRHGGDAKHKGVYCYGLTSDGEVTDASTWVPENRAFGGSLVNPAIVPGGVQSQASATKREDIVFGGVDGGTGGCGCSWANWK